MPSHTDLNIDHVANLARLALTPREKEQFSAQLDEIISYVEQLRELDVDGVEPSAHAFDVHNVLDEDIVRPGLTVEQALRNAPARRDNLFAVPTVVE